MHQNELKNRHFSYLNFFRWNWKNILVVIICGFINAFACVVLLYSSSTIPNGLDSFSFSLSYIFPVTAQYMMLIYLGLNLPLIIFFWSKLKREFILLTLIYLLFNGLFGILFAQDFSRQFFIGKVFAIVQNGLIVPDKLDGSTKIVREGWPIFIFMLLAVIINSPTNALLWKNGASTGGTDVIAYYISIKKKKNVGGFLICIGYLLAFVSIIVLVSIKKFAKLPINGFNEIGGIQTLSTFVFIFLDGILVNSLYPKYKKVKVKIDVGSNPDIIVNWLTESEYYHPYKIIQVISGYTKQKIYSIETVMLFLECEEFVEKAREVDANCWISIFPITKVSGSFNYSYIE